eukprot:167202-Alexandrium_andersonii.AAC.1
MTGSDGKVVSDPAGLDRILREAWEGVYDGGQVDREEQAAAFLEKYAPDAYTGPTIEPPPLTGHFLRGVALKSPATAAGLDGWRPSELRWLSELAFQKLAD